MRKMTNWKEELIIEYLALGHEKERVEEEMMNDPQIGELDASIQKMVQEAEVLKRGYIDRIRDYQIKMSKLKVDFVERWDSQDKSFKCNTGNATIRTTRSLKIRNKEELILILQKMDKLADCITGWDLSYLRKLVDVGLIKMAIANYEEKQSVTIGATRK